MYYTSIIKRSVFHDCTVVREIPSFGIARKCSHSTPNSTFQHKRQSLYMTITKDVSNDRTVSTRTEYGIYQVLDSERLSTSYSCFAWHSVVSVSSLVISN